MKAKWIGIVSVLALCALILWPNNQAPADAPKKDKPITGANWGERVGFKPDLSGAPKAGVTINENNLEKYKKWVPEGVETLVEKYKLRMRVKDYQPIRPSDGYIAATNRHLGDPKIIPNKDPRTLAIENYTAGLPFPDPKTGEEVAYNYHFSYQGDDGGFHYGVYWIDANSGVERWEEWQWEYITRVQFRTDIEPIPAIPDLAEEGIAYRSITWAVAPQDKRGFAALYSRMVEPLDQQGWIYLPPTRRTMRMTFGTRGDAWNNTDLLYEDVRGYMGYPEWMNWELKGKVTMLAPMHSGITTGREALRQAFDFNTWPHWNLNAQWEPRPLYVVEATPRLPDYPYSRQTFYFCAESYLIPMKAAYDQKGELWKVVINAYNESPDPTSKPPGVGTALVVDLQAEHATAFPAYGVRSNVGLDPSRFTLTNLRRMGR